MTEKLWDAIKGGCLPVYHGGDGSTVCDDFPRGSLIEAAGKPDEELVEEIATMNRREASERYEACLDVYLRIVREERHQRSTAAMLTRTAEFLEAVMQSSTAELPEEAGSS